MRDCACLWIKFLCENSIGKILFKGLSVNHKSNIGED